MRFAVFTHVIHQEQKGRLHAYSPYIREMNLWFKYAHKIEIVAPLEEGRDKRSEGERENRGQGEPYNHYSITFTKIPSFHLLNFPAVIDSLIKIPVIFFRILGAMRRADHLHIRCPGNIGLLAAVAQIFFPKKPKTVKYAGNWDPGSTQPWTYRLQKWILSNTFLSRNIKVLAYGHWPNQSVNILPLFTASFSEAEKEVNRKDFKPPFKFVFTGNLVAGKGVFEAIELIEALNKKGVNSELRIYGDGILKDALNNYIQKKDLQKLVKLRGRKSLEGLKEAYKKAHFVILLSNSEGWPKTIAEGMWYGCVPITTPVSCVPWMLKAPPAPKGRANIITLGKRGILLSNGLVFKLQKNSQFDCPDGSRDVSRTGFSAPLHGRVGAELDFEELIRLLENPETLEEMSRAAQEWSQQYTLEKFEKGINEILKSQTTNSKHQTLNQLTTSDSYSNDNQLTTDNSQPKTPDRQLTTDNNKSQTSNSKQLRVLQMVDSLNPGGAERMAINLANSLEGELGASYLCCTREEGMLKEELDESVGYVFLNKNHSLDLQAFWKLREFVKREQVDLVHAHGTSWFWGVLLKISGLKIKLVWHDHYGESAQLNKRDIKLLKPLSRYFNGIIAVNDDLKTWAKEELSYKRVIQMNNFIVSNKAADSGLKLKGDPTDFKIVCVANLRPQKDHLNLLAAFQMLHNEKISLHLIGSDPGTIYSQGLKKEVTKSGKKIFYYGSIPNVFRLLEQGDLGVLSSRSEGLPLALLEYGLAGLPVVCTEVGQCREVVEDTALLVPPSNPEALAESVMLYFENPDRRKKDAFGLQKKIKMEYSKELLLPKLLQLYAT